MKRVILIILLTVISATAKAEIVEIDNEELNSLIEMKIPIIDIRRKEEWQQTGIVAGSYLMTFFDKEGKADVTRWLQELEVVASKKDPFILICRTGRRTGIVAKFLSEKLGYKKVYDVTDGITEWIKKGNPTVKP